MAHAASTGTVVAVVGTASDDALATLDGLPGVEALALHGYEPGLAARRIAAAGTTWVVHDADPLEHVGAAWVELFEERATLGTLEVEVETALAHFAAGDAIMPDYYIVLDPGTRTARGGTGGAALSVTSLPAGCCRHRARRRRRTGYCDACSRDCRRRTPGRIRHPGFRVWRSTYPIA